MCIRDSCGLDGIEYHRRRIGSLLMLHKVDTASLSPDFQLVDGRCTEGIRRRHKHLFALGLEIGRHLADGGGLSRTVYADDKNDGWLGIHMERLFLSEHIGDDLL